MPGKTKLEIRGEDFWIHGQPTYAGRSWTGNRIEGLLFNSRMIQATFDDLNPDTRDRWAYPDTGKWDPDRNTDEFVAMLPEYRRHGLLAVTVTPGSTAPLASLRVPLIALCASAGPDAARTTIVAIGAIRSN